MGANQLKSKKTVQHSDVFEHLISDPTTSSREIARKLGTYRQKVWREKKELEEGHVIWGYTAVFDESKIGHVVYIVLLKTKPVDKPGIDLLLKRILNGEPKKEDVRLINLSYVNGDFDWILKFSAPHHAAARRYYDKIRVLYGEYLLEKPVMIDVNFSLVRSGKINPEVSELYEFIPV